MFGLIRLRWFLMGLYLTPYPGNYPANDKTVDMMWGFDAELVGPDGFIFKTLLYKILSLRSCTS